MASARSGMYGFLAGLCAMPSKATIQEIAGRSLAFSNSGSLPPGLTDALRALMSYKPDFTGGGLETDLQVEFTKLFRGVSKGYSPPPPYESVYRDGLLQGRTAREVAAAYSANGLELSKGSKELPDYIGVELKFMSMLASKEAEAWKSKSGRGLDLIRAQRQFAKEHILTWIPRFCARAEKLATSDFYRASMRLLQTAVEWDASLLNGLEETASGLE